MRSNRTLDVVFSKLIVQDSVLNMNQLGLYNIRLRNGENRQNNALITEDCEKDGDVNEHDKGTYQSGWVCDRHSDQDYHLVE